MLQGQMDRDGSALEASPDIKQSLQQSYPLADGCHAYASAVDPAGKAASLIGDFQKKIFVVAREQDSCRSRVPKSPAAHRT